MTRSDEDDGRNDTPQPVTVTTSDGLQLTLEETLVLNAVWGYAERVDWAAYERLRLRVFVWSSLASPAVAQSEEAGTVGPVADANTR